MTVATLALLAHPASALGGATPSIDGTWGLHSHPILTTHLGDTDKDPYVIIDGQVVFVILPPIEVGNGEVTIGTKVDEFNNIFIGYRNPDGSITIDVDTDDGTVSYNYDYDDGHFYINGGGKTGDGKTGGGYEFHGGIHVGGHGTVGVSDKNGVIGVEGGVHLSWMPPLISSKGG